MNRCWWFHWNNALCINLCNLSLTSLCKVRWRLLCMLEQHSKSVCSSESFLLFVFSWRATTRPSSWCWERAWWETTYSRTLFPAPLLWVSGRICFLCVCPGGLIASVMSPCDLVALQGGCATFLCQPLDVMKTRLMSSKGEYTVSGSTPPITGCSQPPMSLFLVAHPPLHSSSLL